MRIDLMRDSGKDFPNIGEAGEVTSVRIWHCKYKTLEKVADFRNVRELVIAGLPDSNLAMLGGLESIEYLSIVHLPKVGSLEPLSGLKKLETLSLATNPSWDSSGRRQQIESLTPISKLPILAHLEIFGICPAERSLAALFGCKQLETARFSGFLEDDVRQFYEATGAKNEFNPKSSFG